MNDFLNIFLKDISSITNNLIIDHVIKSTFDKKLISLDYYSKSKKGDVSTNILMVLKNFLVNKDFNLSKLLFEEINKINYIKNAEITKIGFINIFFMEKFLMEKINDVIKEKNNYGQNNLGKGLKINIEFVSANPTGPIHVAHLRGAIYGDILSNILKKNGYNIIKEYYVNDSGSQILSLTNSLYKRYQQLNGLNVSINESEYPGQYLIEIAKNIFSKDSNKWLNIDIEKRNSYFKKYAVKEILTTIIKDLKLIDISFDKFSYESEIVKQNKILEVFNILKKKNLLFKGILEKPKGEDLIDWEPRTQLLFKSTKFNDDADRAFQKENGEWTYFANDSAYHYDKISRNFDLLINIWGSDHIGYIKRMKSIVEVISNKKNILEIKICQIVRLFKNSKIFKMSKRKDDFISLKNIFNEVGKDPLRYYMISKKNETPIDFDINKVIEKNKDNQVFYCQYAYARASSVINKAINIKEFKEFNKQLIKYDNNISIYEKEIILKIISWPYVLMQSAKLKQPHKIINYIEDLCALFHSFWNKGKDNKSLRLLDLSDQTKTTNKLLWIESMRIVLKNAFEIIGIDPLEKM